MFPMRGRRAAALLLAAVLAGSGAAAFLWLRRGRESGKSEPGWPGVERPPLTRQAPPNTGDDFNLLVVVLGTEGSGRDARTVADVTVLMRLDMRLKRAACLFMPRTTYLEIRDRGKVTLDELWSLGGLPLMKASLQDVTGLIIERHLVLRQEQLARLVDLYGEISFTLTETVSDPRAGTLQPGPVRLDGSGTAAVIAYKRYGGGELGRIAVQQSLMLSAAAQLHRAASRPAFAWTLSLAAAEMDTDLSTDSLLRLFREFSSWPVADLSVGTAPGVSGSLGGKRSVFLLDEAGLRDTVSSMLAAATVPAP